MQATKEQVRKMDRLKKRSDFLRVQSAGKKWVAKGLVLQAASGVPGRVRYGLTISKKTSKSAVVRNRIKRRLRAVVCDILPQCALDGMDYVLIGRPESETRSYAGLRGDLLWCLEKLELKRGENKQ